MLDFIKTPLDIQKSLRDTFKQKRLLLKLTQEGVVNRSGVSLGSIKRFESTAEISLTSLLKIANVLECLEEFSSLCKIEPQKASTMEELSKVSDIVIPKKGTLK
ncbi:helix-turn-helix transcriptional regulator [Sulfurimonas sp. SAG-AH-194-C20]|nr:helix-turn-helix transcriptional regulator [Sulfurimonas sp. SAG-AH-194-C20]